MRRCLLSFLFFTLVLALIASCASRRTTAMLDDVESYRSV